MCCRPVVVSGPGVLGPSATALAAACADVLAWKLTSYERTTPEILRSDVTGTMLEIKMMRLNVVSSCCQMTRKNEWLACAISDSYRTTISNYFDLLSGAVLGRKYAC